MKKNIVVCEKDNNCLELFGEFFNQHGFNAITISSLNQLLHFIENNPTDVIISDADLFINESKKYINKLMEKINHIPVLYLSEKNKTRILKDDMKINHHRVIEKPVTFVALLESVYKELNN